MQKVLSTSNKDFLIPPTNTCQQKLWSRNLSHCISSAKFQGKGWFVVVQWWSLLNPSSIPSFPPKANQPHFPQLAFPDLYLLNQEGKNGGVVWGWNYFRWLLVYLLCALEQCNFIFTVLMAQLFVYVKKLAASILNKPRHFYPTFFSNEFSMTYMGANPFHSHNHPRS